MSDITLLTVADLIEFALLAGSPGALAGAALGAYAWRSRRIAGAVLGALAGFPLCLAAILGVMFVISN